MKFHFLKKSLPFSIIIHREKNIFVKRKSSLLVKKLEENYSTLSNVYGYITDNTYWFNDLTKKERKK